uniref:C3H1-type domain-containing protein n=1 Tax=Acrobeloides nanus TaxID=290746 RepID=A0A914CPV0_9BILA
MEDLNLAAKKWFYIDEKNGKNILGPFSSSEMLVRYNMGDIRKEYMIKTEADSKFFSYETCYALCGKSPFIQQFSTINNLIHERRTSGQPVPDIMQSFLPNPSTSSQSSQMEKLKKKLDQAEIDNLSLKVQCKKVIFERDEARKRIYALENDLKDKDTKLHELSTQTASISKEVELQNHIKTLEKQLIEMRSKKEDAEKKADTCVTILKTHVNSISQMREDLENTMKEKKELQERVKMLESQHSAMDQNQAEHIKKSVELTISRLKTKLGDEQQELAFVQNDYKTNIEKTNHQNTSHLDADFQKLQAQLKEETASGPSTGKNSPESKKILLKTVVKSEPKSSIDQEMDEFLERNYDSDDSIVVVDEVIESPEKLNPDAPVPWFCDRPPSEPLDLEVSAYGVDLNKKSDKHTPSSPEILIVNNSPTQPIPLNPKSARTYSDLSNPSHDLPEPNRSHSNSDTIPNRRRRPPKFIRSGNWPRASRVFGSEANEVIQYGDLLIDLSQNMRGYYEEICEALERGVVEPCVFYLNNGLCKFKQECFYLHFDEMTAGLRQTLDGLKKVKTRPLNTILKDSWKNLKT